MTLFERLRGWLSPTGRNMGWSRDQVWPESNKLLSKAIYDAGLKSMEDGPVTEFEPFVDPITEAAWAEVLAEGERMAAKLETVVDEWTNEGGAPAGKVPNCS